MALSLEGSVQGKFLSHPPTSLRLLDYAKILQYSWI